MREYLQLHSGPVPFFGIGVGEEALRKEIFFLAYHLHWSWTELMEMDTAERRAYVELLVDQIERENRQIDQSKGS